LSTALVLSPVAVAISLGAVLIGAARRMQREGDR
jgi:hypothetical protein